MPVVVVMFLLMRFGDLLRDASCSGSSGRAARTPRLAHTAPRARRAADVRMRVVSFAAPALVLALLARLLRGRRGDASSRSSKELPRAVSDSAKSIAALRALESERTDPPPLFVDPFAAALAGEETLARVRARGDGDKGRIAIRTRFFDDAVLAALARHRTAQVVLLGAGLDTRAWRLSPPEGKPKARAVFELDVPEVLDRKARILAETATANANDPAAASEPPPLTLAERHVSVHANFARPGWIRALRDAGHDPSIPTVWILEGLLYYLSPDVVDRVLRGAANASAAGSTLVASVVNRASWARATRKGSKGAKATWASWMDDPEESFGAAGWTTTTVAQPGEARAAFGRWRGESPPPRGAEREGEPQTPRTFYVVCRVVEE